MDIQGAYKSDESPTLFLTIKFIFTGFIVVVVVVVLVVVVVVVVVALLTLTVYVTPVGGVGHKNPTVLSPSEVIVGPQPLV
jgi:hypothetical protein